jgi:hypothetical protein
MRKTVSFGPRSETPKPLDVVDTEAVWYSKSDLVTQRQDGRRLAEEMVGADEEDMGDSLRGLEQFQGGPKTSRRRRQEYVKSVLALQKELQEMKVHDPKGIQAFASAHTSRDCKDARRRAKNDAAVAGSKVHTPRRQMSLRSMSPRKTIGATCA